MEANGNWLVLRLKSNREKAVPQFLENKGIVCYLPKRALPRVSASPPRESSSILFPGYLFVNLPSNNASDLRYVPGTCGVVAFNGRPAIVSDGEIQQIRKLAASEMEIQRHDQLYQGDRVLIINGPLSGIEGIFVRLKNSDRLIVNVLMLNQSLSVEIGRDWLSCPRRPPAQHSMATGIAHRKRGQLAHAIL